MNLDELEKFSNKRIKELALRLGPADQLLRGKACVYATGSLGRLETYQNSDLDLFIVGIEQEVLAKEKPKRLLSHLDEVCVKADIIRAARTMGIPDLDGDGKYLVYHSKRDLVGSIGTNEDDVRNTLTARLLLFLESRPLLGEEVYRDVITSVIHAYWRDFHGHESEFIPAYLANDILRLWRTFCVNYEARTRREPEDERIEGKIKNYKLKHSRILTCFSALAYLLKIHADCNTVTPENAFAMTQQTPLRRLSWVRETSSSEDVRETIKRLFSQYEIFLTNTSKGTNFLREHLENEVEADQLRRDSHNFGELMFNVLRQIGQDSRFFRLLVV